MEPPPVPSRPVLRPLVGAVLLALVGALVPAVAVGAASDPVAFAAAGSGTVSWADDFTGDALAPRWQVVNAEPGHLSVSRGALHID